MIRLAHGLTVALALPAVLMSATQAQPAAVGTTNRSSAMQVSIDVPRQDAQALARAWGLHDDEWTRYQQLMQGPLGLASPQLDPLSALGIEARSDAERRHYAELQVQFEVRRVQKELRYQQAYDAAWKQLYPTLQPVNLHAPATDTAASADVPGRLAVFVKDGCAACDDRVRALQAQGSTFDVYMVGSRQDDGLIRQWAQHAGVDPARVRARTITLNHDAGRWLSIGGQGDLPAIVREVDGQWQRQ
ncbi:integrating conjugative element protein, PFL_4693 family [Paraburkholderia aspalathi]|uniref:Integrating conjugative element protein, PFL_4693 family n=2 Tax=Paraburkholderia aspalathi TaxID=1324617 RepID=A0A1I7AAA2_9BURK|nr:TIGR03759 family integrating conjugative element protein [Paraburkholderia aspalathi]SFT71770.1 integrating conjugative element protein, PFL_4693 family [Paraburkholderia aspalathi]